MYEETLSVLDDQTDVEGKAKYTYLCSGIGGVDSVFVRGIKETDTASAVVVVKVEGLEELKAGDHYELTGAYGDAGVKSRHRVNHYASSMLLSKLKELADSVYAIRNYRLRINDMSLVNGGPFDIRNNWDTPHQTHRIGISADIDDYVRTTSGGLKAISERQFWIWMRKVVERPKINAEGDHFHVTIR